VSKPSLATLLPVGTKLYGYCNGFFGRNSYNEKRVEAVGTDWVVARDLCTERPVMADLWDWEEDWPTLPEMVENWKSED
jgi:hypothetical protein